MTKLDIALTDDEVEAFLGAQRTVRLATSGGAGGPQVVPLWFVWLDGALFMNSTLGNRTIVNLTDDPRAAAVVDDGDEYESLRGVVLRGEVTVNPDDPRLERVRERWSAKYMGGGPLPYDRWRSRVWMRLDPSDVASWDFRKIPEARARRGAGA